MQLQKALPALRPLRATIFRMARPHFGHAGAPAACTAASRAASRAALMRSVKPPSVVKSVAVRCIWPVSKAHARRIMPRPGRFARIDKKGLVVARPFVERPLGDIEPLQFLLLRRRRAERAAPTICPTVFPSASFL